MNIAGQEELFRFPAYQEPQLVLFDRGNHILKKLTQDQPTSAWLFQLEHADLAIDRSRAIEQLRWSPDTAAVPPALLPVLINDPTWFVRRDAAWMINDAKVFVGDSIYSAYGDRDARVRSAVATAMRRGRGDAVLKTLEHAFDYDSSYAVVASALRSLQEANPARAQDFCLRALEKSSHRELIRTAALNALAAFHDERSYAAIASWTRYGADRNLRVLALNLLGKGWKEREDLLPLMIAMAGDPSLNVRRTAIDNLGNLGSLLAVPVLEERVAREEDPRLVKAARDAIEKIQQARR